ncbi:hypothetical protein ABMA32_01090 [Mesorhizobium sp. VNQ89]|uniref:hypothetical protein n=1 Tax=Mesorhizobium quangtriensis TaxID=3157709 RepID=UPI0032B82ADB
MTLGLSAWTDFLAAVAGATAALLGLFFVSLSLNLEKVLAGNGLTERAEQALIQLLAALMVALFLLMPGLSLFVAGNGVLVIAAVTGVMGTLLAARSLRRAKGYARVYTANLVLFELAILPWLVGGVLLMAGNADGAYWLAAGICLSIAKAAFDSWVFLVEINR